MFDARSRAGPVRRFAMLDEADDPAPLYPEVVHARAGSQRQFPPQQRTERLHPCLDRLDPHPQRVAGCHAQADLAGDKPLPALEPPRVVTHHIAVAVAPGCRRKVDERRLKHADNIVPHVEEARAARPPQILPPRGRQHVAADPPHIDRELADRLAGIEQIQDAVALRDASDFGRRIDQPALRRHVRDRDQLGARADRALGREIQRVLSLAV